MDCKNRHIDVFLAHCKGKYQLTAKLFDGLYILTTLAMLACLFIAASLIKAMQYGGNLESETPVFFESLSSAIDAIQIHSVRLTARVGNVCGASWMLTAIEQPLHFLKPLYTAPHCCG